MTRSNPDPNPDPKPNPTPNLMKVYDVLFALGVVIIGRRLSRCPKAQRVLEFVSEA